MGIRKLANYRSQKPPHENLPILPWLNFRGSDEVSALRGVGGRISSKPVDDLARAAQRMMSLKFRLSVIGSIVVLILALLFFFLFWLPEMKKFDRKFDNLPGSLPSPQVLPKNH